MSERWRRLRNWSWALWAPLTVAVVSASLALYLALWAAYDVVPGWHVGWLGVPRLSTTQIVPLLIGALGVTATTSAILAGVGKLAVVFPRQRLAFRIRLDRPAGGDPVIRVSGWNAGAFISAYSFTYELRDSDDVVCATDVVGGRGSTLVPGQGFDGQDLRVTAKDDRVGGKLIITWATDRSNRVRVTVLPVREPE